jgi:hypothetical protein
MYISIINKIIYLVGDNLYKSTASVYNEDMNSLLNRLQQD